MSASFVEKLNEFIKLHPTRREAIEDIVDAMEKAGLPIVEINAVVSSYSNEQELASLRLAIANAYDDVVNNTFNRDVNLKPGENPETRLILDVHEQLQQNVVLATHITRGHVLQLINDYVHKKAEEVQSK